MIKIKRLIKKSNKNLKKAICKIDGKNILCEIINNYYNDHAIEVSILEGSNIGIPAIVEKSDIICEDEELQINYETTKNEVFKLMMKEEITKVIVELRNYYDKCNKSYLVAYMEIEDMEEQIDIAYSTSLLMCQDNTDKLIKEQNKMAKKIAGWLNNNYTVETIIIDI